jgi:hypothetical protein
LEDCGVVRVEVDKHIRGFENLLNGSNRFLRREVSGWDRSAK